MEETQKDDETRKGVEKYMSRLNGEIEADFMIVMAAAGAAMMPPPPFYRKHNDKNVSVGLKQKKSRSGQSRPVSKSRAKAKAARKARKINRRAGR